MADIQVHEASAQAFKTGRTTVYKGITMRSRLEALWAGHLDRLGIGWEYEPQCFANERGQYLPDFRVDGISREYLDVKGVLPTDISTLRRKMQIIWESEPGALLTIVVGAPPEQMPDGIWMWSTVAGEYQSTGWFPEEDGDVCQWETGGWGREETWETVSRITALPVDSAA